MDHQLLRGESAWYLLENILRGGCRIFEKGSNCAELSLSDFCLLIVFTILHSLDLVSKFQGNVGRVVAVRYARYA